MKAEINKQVELVQILLFLAEEQEKTVQYLANKVYLQKITDWFEPYKEHTARKLFQKYTR